MKPRQRHAPIIEFTDELEPTDADERRTEKASRWYAEYVPNRGWPPEDRPA